MAAMLLTLGLVSVGIMAHVFLQKAGAGRGKSWSGQDDCTGVAHMLSKPALPARNPSLPSFEKSVMMLLLELLQLNRDAQGTSKSSGLGAGCARKLLLVGMNTGVTGSQAEKITTLAHLEQFMVPAWGTLLRPVAQQSWGVACKFPSSAMQGGFREVHRDCIFQADSHGSALQGCRN